MIVAVQIYIYVDTKIVYRGDFAGPLELGRQQNDDGPPYSRSHGDNGERLVIAPLNESGISRRYVLLEPLKDGQIRVTNLSAKLPVELLLQSGNEIGPLESRSFRPPVMIRLGSVSIALGCARDDEYEFHSLNEPSIAPGRSLFHDSQGSRLTSMAVPGVDPQSLVVWLRVAIDVFHSAMGSADFLQKAAQATADLVNLDFVGVLLRQAENWESAASAGAFDEPNSKVWRPSQFILSRVCQDKRGIWANPIGLTERPVSLIGIAAVVAAPILDPEGNVIGVLYGDRRRDDTSIGELEAMLVELLASGIAAGLARVEQQAARVRLQQFFSSNLVHQIETDQNLLEGKEANVTVMVCDICGFSSVSERLGAAETLRWVRDVIGVLSDCVVEHQGVLVDYVGDEVMAMWGAPAAQADDVAQACRAAIDMRRSLAQVNERWQSVLNEPTNVGIGINVGPAYVGNVGSHHKFKYGPLGDTVNLASRVQGASKYLGSFLLITGEVQAQLDDSFATRRLCQVRVKNISKPVTLFELAELAEEVSEDWLRLKQQYEKALEHFENSEFRSALEILGGLQAEFPDDGPSMVLLKRSAAERGRTGHGELDSVWELPGK